MAKIGGTLDYAGLEQLTTAQRTAIAAADLFPGRMVYDTDLETAFLWDATAGSWERIPDGNELDTHISDTSTHGITGPSVIVGTEESQTLTNKTINADNNTITNLAHGAEVDNPSSGVHGVTGNVVGDSDAQTLTNKTIDGDSNTVQDLALSSSKQDIPNANKLIGRDGAGDVAVVKDTPTGDVVGTTDIQTLSNKTISGGNNTISGLSHGSEVNDPSSGVHGVSGNVVGDVDAQTLTNKTLTSPVINASISGTAIDNDAALTADSATLVPTQQAVKAYTDAVDSSLTTHIGDTSTHGITGPSVIVGTEESQTLINKTINADNNTITNLAHGAEVDNPTSDVHGATGALFGLGDDPSFTSTSHIKLPAGTTGERSVSPVNGMIRYNSTTNSVEAYENGSWGSLGGGGGGGGGAGGFVWNEPEGVSPTRDELASERVYDFAQGAGQKLVGFIKVPQSYLAGTRITMWLSFCVQSAGTDKVRLQPTTYLIEPGDPITDTTDSYLSVNLDTTLTGVSNALLNELMYLTDAVGQINGNAVAPGDMLRVELTRTAPTGTEDGNDIQFIPSATEVLFV